MSSGGPPPVISRAAPCAVALETTLLIHGVPKGEGARLARELAAIATGEGASAALVGVHSGRPIVGLSDQELADLLNAERVPKGNTSNLGLFLHAKSHAATTVATTMELAAGAGVRVFATGGIGGVHRGYATHLDISADLAAFTRFPVAVVTSGVKSLLDVPATREALETLGIPVVGVGTNDFPAFYLRSLGPGGPKVDARVDDVEDLARFVAAELVRTKRGIVIANPIPERDELPRAHWDRWVAAAMSEAQRMGVSGREVTPYILGALHRLSGGETLRANIALIRHNVLIASRLAVRLGELRPGSAP